jgi:hypothetical protein
VVVVPTARNESMLQHNSDRHRNRTLPKPIRNGTRKPLIFSVPLAQSPLPERLGFGMQLDR